MSAGVEAAISFAKPARIAGSVALMTELLTGWSAGVIPLALD
jgi:hypothetical protein